jgi:hypothetical protein
MLALKEGPQDNRKKGKKGKNYFTKFPKKVRY